MNVNEDSEKVGLKLNIQKTKIMASCPISSWKIDGETMETVPDFILGGLQNHCRWWLQPWNSKTLVPWKKSYDKPRQHIKNRDITLPTKVHLVKAMVFPVVMYGCESWDYKTSWGPKNWCFWTVVLEKPFESPLDCKEIQPVHPKGDQSWVFTGRTDVEADTPIFWPPDAKNWLIGKDPDAGKDWRQEEKGTTEDGMVGWHHRLDGHEFE